MSSPFSPIPRPGGGRGYEYVPRPGIPKNFPWYLKPIPVNTRDIRKEFAKYLRENSKRIARILYSSITANPGDIKYQEIRNALASGDIDRIWLRKWQQKYYQQIVDDLEPEWEQAWDSATRIMSSDISAAAGTSFTTTASSAYAREWMSQHAAERVVKLQATQERALRAVLTHYTNTEPVGTAELGRLIRSTIGLTPKQVESLKVERSRLIAEGFSSKEIETELGNYEGYLHRERAFRIATTEIQYAYNNGQLNGIKEARDSGLFSDRVMIKKWDASPNACEFCTALDGQVLLLDELFPHKLNGAAECPPCHPYCTCGLKYEIWELADFERIMGRAPIPIM